MVCAVEVRIAFCKADVGGDRVWGRLPVSRWSGIERSWGRGRGISVRSLSGGESEGKGRNLKSLEPLKLFMESRDHMDRIQKRSMNDTLNGKGK